MNFDNDAVEFMATNERIFFNKAVESICAFCKICESQSSSLNINEIYFPQISRIFTDDNVDFFGHE